MAGSPPSQFDDDDANRENTSAGKSSKEFECPSCNANNPYDEGFSEGDEIRCFYCGLEYKVEARGDGRFKFREI